MGGNKNEKDIVSHPCGDDGRVIGGLRFFRRRKLQPAGAPASSAAGSTAANSEAASAPAEGAITSAADLAGKKIGVQAGTTGEVYVQENVADAELGSYNLEWMPRST